MVFGTTYCAVSHLPIKDGDKCMLLPLGFDMRYNFDKNNKADVGCFMYVYRFIDEPVEVVYKGNPAMLDYMHPYYQKVMQYDAYELFMLVHFEFYYKVQSEYLKNVVLNIDDLRNFKTFHEIYEKAQKLREEIRYSLKDKQDEKLVSTYLSGGIAPNWIVAIYKFARFIDELGIIPYPNQAIDQHNRNVVYEKIRKACMDIST